MTQIPLMLQPSESALTTLYAIKLHKQSKCNKLKIASAGYRHLESQIGPGNRTRRMKYENAHGVLEEHTRMLVVVHAAVAVVWSFGQKPFGPFVVWMSVLFLLSTLWGTGRLGTGRVKLLIATGLMVGLLCTGIVLRSSAAGVVVTAVLFLLCGLQLTAEEMGRRISQGSEAEP